MAMRAKTYFVTATNPPRVVRAGDLVGDKDPVLKGREDLFEPVEEYLDRRSNIEQATAAPGERRSVAVPKKRAVKRPSDKPVSDGGDQ
jgi:hypothetical protein